MAQISEETLKGAGDALASQLDALIDSASELMDELGEQGEGVAEDLRSRASRNIRDARRRLASLSRQVPESASHAAQAATRLARRNPWSTVAVGTLVAAAIGLVVYASLNDD